MITIHQYVDQYPIRKESEKLILGTIHPHYHQKFLIPFFYGNEMTLWKLLNEAFPKELIDPITLPGIINFLRKRKISISDTIIECSRINHTALDKDLKPIRLNENLIANIKRSHIKEILFTSGFGKNNAFKLFYVDILGLKITKTIKENRGVILNDSRIGRPIKLKVLYSPAGTANVGLSKSKIYKAKAHKYAHLDKPVKRFKVDYFKEMFTTSN